MDFTSDHTIQGQLAGPMCNTNLLPLPPPVAVTVLVASAAAAATATEPRALSVPVTQSIMMLPYTTNYLLKALLMPYSR